MSAAWCLFMFLAFVLVGFGFWGTWVLVVGMIVGFVYMIFTNINR